MGEMSRRFLSEAFAGESQAHMKYLIFASRAREEGFENVARLFEAIAFAELVHARNHLEALGEVGETKENLVTAINGENWEVEEMYPAYNAVAELQNDNRAKRSIRFAIEAEKIHSAMYTKAKQAVENGKDIEIGEIYICEVCGYTTDTKIDRCPVCGAGFDRFRKF
ncbi:Rubrerythrin [Geoglobus ahangari]|uniref:Rubrerythrin n=1 Tax=Geoglobus ahangari TaxID=113653 RepID=A0A0F7DC24_9EURY|nr:rubrerythrin family protein [Geoglobus ahangari]AKG92096.1 Rubrerythrin [Geoglobus ahangari]